MNIKQITFTRFMAAFAIVIYHYGREIFFFTNENISFLFKKANIGVSYFYILSGFIMIIAYGNKKEIKILDYYKNRFSRVYPMYIFALLFFLILNFKFPLKEILLSVFALQTWIPGKALSLNSPGWSISVEAFFLSTISLSDNLFLQPKKSSTVAVVIALIWIASQIFINWFANSHWHKGYPSKSHDFGFYFPVMHLNEFLLGNLTGLLFLKKKHTKNYDLLIAILVISFTLLLKFTNLQFHNGLMGIIFAPLIFFISANTGYITKILSHRFLIYLGEISFAMYILQYPINIFVENKLKSILLLQDSLNFFVAYIIILIGFSIFSYELIEKPSRTFIKNFLIK